MVLDNEAKHFFNRVANIWNYLPSNVFDCVTVTDFKNKLGKFFDSNPQLRYDPL